MQNAQAIVDTQLQSFSAAVVCLQEALVGISVLCGDDKGSGIITYHHNIRMFCSGTFLHVIQHEQAQSTRMLMLCTEMVST
jgi:hypothetical protein